MIYIVKCRDCGKEFKFNLNPKDIERWKEGELIQNVFPNLSAEERELFISHTCGECWEKMFGNDEDEDEFCPDMNER